jgi:hypothetical protein
MVIGFVFAVRSPRTRKRSSIGALIDAPRPIAGTCPIIVLHHFNTVTVLCEGPRSPIMVSPQRVLGFDCVMTTLRSPAGLPQEVLHFLASGGSYARRVATVDHRRAHVASRALYSPSRATSSVRLAVPDLSEAR